VLAAVAAVTQVPGDLDTMMKAAGLSAGTATYILKDSRTASVPWTALLRRYVGQTMKVEPRYGRPPRRSPELAGIVPGRVRAPAELSIVVAIDTSASMTDDLLDMIAAELRGMRRDRSIHVIECDTEIQRVYRFNGRLDSVQGRGGTDLRPPLESVILRPLQPGLVIYFTDGMGPVPETALRIPIIWCLTPSGREPASWGIVIRMRN